MPIMILNCCETCDKLQDCHDTCDEWLQEFYDNDDKRPDTKLVHPQKRVEMLTIDSYTEGIDFGCVICERRVGHGSGKLVKLETGKFEFVCYECLIKIEELMADVSVQ